MTFLAPNLEAGFLAPRTFALRGPVAVVFLRAAEWVNRLAAGLASASVESVLDSGDVDLEISLPAFKKGELVRPTTGGVLVRETGGVGLLIEGLSQEEKKSSLESLAGVAEPSASAGMSVMTTSSGYLKERGGVC